MACISAPTAILASGALGAGTSLFGGLTAAGAAGAASRAQVDAANRAAQLQSDQFQQSLDFLKGRTQLSDAEIGQQRDYAQNLLGQLRNATYAGYQPFEQPGAEASWTLANLTGASPGGNPLTAPLTAPFQPTMAQLEQTPGYQFTLNQGLQATQNAFTAQGLGTSGAALKGAAGYASGLASTTYQQQFQNYLAQNQQIYNMLGGQISTGQAAQTNMSNLLTQQTMGQGSLGLQGAIAEAGIGVNAAGTAGQVGLGAAGQIGSSLMSGGAATAGGIVGGANALNAGIGGVSGAASNTGLLLALNNAGLFGSNPASGGPDFTGGA